MKSRDQVLLEEAYNSIKESVITELFGPYQKQVERIKESGIKIVSFGANSKYKHWNNEELMIANDMGRPLVLIDLGVIKLPFYRSTGDGGKERVESNKWYPMFGVGSNGWYNKCSQSQISNYYGSDLLKHTAQLLDRAIGSDAKCGWNLGSLPDSIEESVYKAVNQDLSPSNEPDKEFFVNVANVLSKVKGIFQIKLKGSMGEIGGNLPFLVGRRVIERVVGEDGKFFSEPQFELYKSKNSSGVLWGIKHSPEAKNATYVNEKEIPTNGQLLRYGDIITLGKSGKGKIIIDV